MRLNKIEGEVLRKRVKILIPQMEKSEIVNHFQKEGYPRRTIYYHKSFPKWRVNRRQNKNLPPNFLDINQKESAEKIDQ